MTQRSTPSFAVGGVAPDAICIVCGDELSGHHFLEVRGFCEAHCPDHDFEYDQYRRGHFCLHCDAEREWEPSEDDVGFGSYPLGPSELIGIPASSMCGNAAISNASPENRQKWDNWVAFCERNGQP